MAITAASLNVQLGTTGAAGVKRDLNDVGNAVDQTGQRSRVLGGAMLGMGTAIAGAFTYGVTEAISFGEQMANVNSIAQLTGGELDTLSDQVLDLSANSGQSAETLASGLYDIYSSGFQGAAGMQVLTAATTAANAGLTTTAVAAKGVTAVLNAYGMSADQAAHVSDVMFQTVNDGVITFEQLSANMGNTLPMANALGVSFEELAAGYAQMTLSGVPASQVETQIASLMRSALNPTEALTAAVQDHGYATVESLIAAEGFTGYLDVLTEASGGSTEALYDLLGTQEAVNAALLLGGENSEAYAAEVEKMRASSVGLGATQTALAKQMESTAFSLRLLKTNVQAAAIAIGVQLEPGIRAVAKAMTAGIKAFLNLSKPVQQAIGLIAALVGVLSLAAGSVALFGTQIAAAAGIFVSLLGPIALVVAAVAGLYLAWETNFLGIRDIVADVVGGVTNFFSTFSDSFRALTKDIKEFNLWGGEIGTTIQGMAVVPAFFLALGNAIAGIGGGVPILEDLGQAIMALPAVIQSAVTEFQRLGDIFSTDGLGAALGVLAIDVASVAVSIGSFLWQAAVDVGASLVQWIRDNGLSVAQDIGNIAVSIGAIIWSAASDIFSGLALWLQGNIGGIAQDIGNVAVAVGGIIWSATADIFSGLALWLQGNISGIAQDIGNITVSVGAIIWQASADIFSGLVLWLQGNVSASGSEVQLDSVSVNISDWLRGNWPDISQWLNDQVGQPTMTIDALDVAVSGYEVALSGDVGNAIESALVAAVPGLAIVVAFDVLPEANITSSDVIAAIDFAIGATIPAIPILANLEVGFDITTDVPDAIEAAIEASVPGGKILLGIVADIAGLALSIASDLSVEAMVKQAILAAIPGGEVLIDVTAKISSLTMTIDPAVAQAALEAALNAALPGSSIIIDLLDIGGGGGGGGEEQPFGNVDFGGIISQLGEVRDAAGEAGAAVASIFGGGMGAVGGVGAGGAADASGLLGSLASVQTALTGLTTLAATASAAMGAVIAAIANGMTTAQTVLAASVAGMASAMTAGMAIVRSAAASGMAGVIVAVANGMATARSVTAAGAAGMAASMVAGMAVFRAAVTSGMAAAVGAVRSGIAAMVAAASAGRGMMMSAGLGIGAALGQGIAAGIQSMVGAVAAAAAALVSAAIGAARSAGAISSPSRVMQEQVGQMLGLGAALGVEDMYPRMDRAMAGLIRTPTVPYSAGGGLGQSVGSGGGVTITIGPLIVQGSVNGVDDLDARFREFAEGIKGHLTQHRTAVLGGTS